MEVEDEEFNSLVEELESKKLEIQSLVQEKEDLVEETKLLKSKVVQLQNNIEDLSESNISVQFNELLQKHDTLLEENKLLQQKTSELELQLANGTQEDYVSEDSEHASSLKNEVSKFVLQNEEINTLKVKLTQITQEKEVLSVNLETSQKNLLKLQEENQSLEQKISALINESFELKSEKSDLIAQLHEKEQELLDNKIKINQLEEKFDDESIFDQEMIDLPENTDEDNKDELLLRLSEMEMEEANWQDEKRVLLTTIEQLRSSMNKSVSNEDESLQKKIANQEQLITSLKNEIHELSQDIDEADSELKEIEIENGVLRDRISELEAKGKIEPVIPVTSPEKISQLKDENTKLSYQLKEKDSALEESQSRLKSQEQKIEHLESLMEQERQLREKFEFLYSGLKSKLDKKELKRENDNINAKRQLEQVIKSINLSDELTQLAPDKEKSLSGEKDSNERPSSARDDLGKALENTSLYLSLIDKFLKPHVQITQLLKQGDWEINSLAELVSLNRNELMEVLKELSEKNILKYDNNKVWLIEDKELES